MNKYEAMFILKPDSSEEERKAVFTQIADAITKHSGEVAQAAIWADKRKLYFPIKKQNEGLYYLVNFSLGASAVQELRRTYKLNENILRVLITKAQ